MYHERFKTYCKETRLKVYHAKPRLRLYIPYDVSTSLYYRPGRFRRLLINDNDITDYSYAIYNRKTHRVRFVISNAGVRRFNLNTASLYNVCVEKEILLWYRYLWYMPYETTSKDARHFEISVYFPDVINVYDAEEYRNAAFTEGLGSSYYDTLFKVLYIKYMGIEILPRLRLRTVKETEVSQPYFVTDLEKHYYPYAWSNIQLNTIKNIMRYKLKMITLDYDGVDYDTVMNQLSAINNLEIKPLIRYIDIYQTGKGYHVYIYLKRPITPNEILKYREMLGDDSNRIAFDRDKLYIAEKALTAQSKRNGVYALLGFNTLFYVKYHFNYETGKYEEISRETFLKRITQV